LSLTLSLTNPVLAGSTILVFATQANGAKSGVLISSVTDTAGNVYSKLQQVEDTSNAAWQNLYLYAAYNVPAGTPQVTVTYPQVEWQGVLLVEVTGVTSLPMQSNSGNVQLGVGTGTDAITSGTMATTGAPGTLIGVSMATLDTKGAPNAGTGFTSSTTVWNWNGEENSATVPSTRLEYQHYASPGDVAATFTALGSGDNWDTIGIFIPDRQ
jgi:hypothetical protein